jgi:hypothetical protein
VRWSSSRSASATVATSVEGVVAIVTGVMTILLVALHHPFRITLLVTVIGTFRGWWV